MYNAVDTNAIIFGTLDIFLRPCNVYFLGVSDGRVLRCTLEAPSCWWFELFV